MMLSPKRRRTREIAENLQFIISEKKLRFVQISDLPKSDLQLSASQTAHTAGMHYIKDFVTSAVEIKLICAAPNFNVVACQLLFCGSLRSKSDDIVERQTKYSFFFPFQFPVSRLLPVLFSGHFFVS